MSKFRKWTRDEFGWRFWFKMVISYYWRRFKEKLMEIFVCRGKHPPTLLEDDETIICDRCGKVLGSIPRYDKRPICVEEAIKGIPVLTTEEKIRKELLPQPPTPKHVLRRRTYIRVQKSGSQIIQRGYGRFFRGKGKGQLPDYRRSKFAKVDPEEEN